jgi:hypothetical protein
LRISAIGFAVSKGINAFIPRLPEQLARQADVI